MTDRSFLDKVRASEECTCVHVQEYIHVCETYCISFYVYVYSTYVHIHKHTVCVYAHTYVGVML